MQDKDLTEDSSSDAKTQDEPIGKQLSNHYQPPGTVIVGPDAADIHVIGGGDDE